MGLYHDYEDKANFNESMYDDFIEDSPNKKVIKKKLEERLEQKRIREEIDELDRDFDWDDYK